MADHKIVRLTVFRANPDDPESPCHMAAYREPPSAIEPSVSVVTSLDDVWRYAAAHEFDREDAEIDAECLEALLERPATGSHQSADE